MQAHPWAKEGLPVSTPRGQGGAPRRHTPGPADYQYPCTTGAVAFPLAPSSGEFQCAPSYATPRARAPPVLHLSLTRYT